MAVGCAQLRPTSIHVFVNHLPSTGPRREASSRRSLSSSWPGGSSSGRPGAAFPEDSIGARTILFFSTQPGAGELIIWASISPPQPCAGAFLISSIINYPQPGAGDVTICYNSEIPITWRRRVHYLTIQLPAAWRGKSIILTVCPPQSAVVRSEQYK